MEERLRFVGRLLDGESMSDVCRNVDSTRANARGESHARDKSHALAEVVVIAAQGIRERSCR
jgi:hypothetical protein